MKRLSGLLLSILICTMLIPTSIASGTGGSSFARCMVPGLKGEILSVEFTDDGMIGHLLEKSGGSSVLWTTENAGATWSKGTFFSGPMMYPDTYVINDISFDPVDGLSGWAVGEFIDAFPAIPSGYTYKFNPHILHTVDGGKTWTNQSPNIDDNIDLTDQGELTAVYTPDGAYAFACGTNGKLLATHTGGVNDDDWKVVQYNIPTYHYNDITCGDPGASLNGIRVLAVGDNRRVTYFDSSGAPPVWGGVTSLEAGGSGTEDLMAVTWPNTSPFSEDYNDIIAVGDNGFYAYSLNGGPVWEDHVTTDGEDWLGIDFESPTAAFLVGEGGALAWLYWDSEDNDWYESYSIGYNLRENEVPASVNLNDINCFGPDEYWMVGQQGMIMERGASSSARISGSDRYATAITMSSDWPADSCTTVVMATGTDFPDALSASGLAGAYECPLLLTGRTLKDSVKNELTRLGADTVVIVGGESAVPTAVSDALDSAGFDVDRDLAGNNRYDTARLVAERIAALEGSSFSQAAFIARGDGFADALAVSPFAYSQKMPVLLTKPGSLPGDTQTALGGLNIKNAYIAGGTAAVSDGVKGSIDGILATNGGTASERWSGADRYVTAATIAQNGIDAGWATPAFVGLSTGQNFPDALGGGAVCGSSGGVLLLTKSTSLSSAAGTFLTNNSGDILQLGVFGGTAAVSDAVKAAADGKVY